MLFIKENDAYGKTDYHAPVPHRFRHLLIPGLLHQFVLGSWGCYLSLWLEMEEFSFWLHHFFLDEKCKMLAQVAQTIYTINHMLKGGVFAILNTGLPVKLAPDRSHFFIIPAGNYQYVTFDKGYSMSMHIDYKREYLDSRRKHYIALRPLLESYDIQPDQAFYHSSVIHTLQVEYCWRRVYELLGKVADPVLFLEAHARELLRLHYEQVKASMETGADPAVLIRLKPAHLEAIKDARKIIESNITVKHTQVLLARKVGMNVTDFKQGFKAVFGVGIYQYQLRLRMDLACELLLSTDKSNQEIALLCGIKNVSHFVQLFRKSFGMTPRKLRYGQQTADIAIYPPAASKPGDTRLAN